VIKRSQKYLPTLVIKKTPKVNNHPIGENSPNLVTLPATAPAFSRNAAEAAAAAARGKINSRASLLFPRHDQGQRKRFLPASPAKSFLCNTG
jgi:hypothetical protein